MTCRCDSRRADTDSGRSTTATTLVRQQHDYGCGIASLAMITGQSYDEVREWLLANWPGGSQTPDEWLTTRGIHSGVAEYFLGEHGYVWRYVYRAWYPDNWPPAPFAPVHLVMVRQPSNRSHYVVMRADGVVLDPLTDEPRTLTDWPQVDNVAGIWAADDELAAAIERTRAYVEDPGNWSALDGRRATLLSLLRSS